MTTSDTSAAWFGHPRPLARLFAIEMWERFGYYGMRALLMLYLTKHFVLGDHASAGIYGGYTALVYLTPLVGGLLADQYLGSKRAVAFGALVMAAGYFALAFGGAPAKPWAEYDGVRHPVVVSHFVDRPTSAEGETRAVLDGGRALTVKGREDGSIDLIAPDGTVARHLPERRAARRGGPRWLARGADADGAVGGGGGQRLLQAQHRHHGRRALCRGRPAARCRFHHLLHGHQPGRCWGNWRFRCWRTRLAGRWGWVRRGWRCCWPGWCCAWPARAPYGEPPVLAGRDPAWLIYLGGIAAIPLSYLLFTNLMATPPPTPGGGLLGYLAGLPLMGKLLVGTFTFGLAGILAWSWKVGSRVEFQMMLAAVILMAFNSVFWSLFEQAGSSLTLFAAM
jgi:POT family proton-dependent oligopeptide transporter